MDEVTEAADTTALRQELEKAAEPEDRKTVLDLIARQKPELEKALPAAIGVERFTRTVLTEIRRTPKLLECAPESLLGAMMLAAQLGLEPGPLGHVYLVPFKRQVEFVIGYRGYIDLAYRSGMVKAVSAELVHEGDAFKVEKGTAAKIVHVPLGPPDDREIIAAYAVAKLTTGGVVFADTYLEDWERARKASAAGAKDVGPWKDHRAAMIRKTAVRRLAPLLPQSPLFAQATVQDEVPAPAIEDVTDDAAI